MEERSIVGNRFSANWSQIYTVTNSPAPSPEWNSGDSLIDVPEDQWQVEFMGRGQ